MKNLKAGKLYGWGAGHTGVLGDGPSEDKPTPQQIAYIPPVCAIAAGRSSAYAIDCEGRVWSWGWDEFHYMLGRGDVEYPLPMVPTALRKLGHKITGRIEGDGGVGKPAPVEGLPPVTQLSVADQNVYALTADGEVWGWGDQEGLGRRGRKKSKVPEPITVLKNICQISSSPIGLACYALDENKRIWSWGNGYEGELGHGKPRFDPVPQVIPTLEQVKSVHAGSSSAWALLEDGSVWFWGHGQNIGLTQRNTYRIKEPVQIKELLNIESIFIGEYMYIARNKSSETYALGHGCIDMLGLEANDCNLVRTVKLDMFQDFYLGSSHGLALDAEGKLFSFGDAGNGALGNGDEEEQKFYFPAPVPGLGKIITAAAGNHYSLAILSE